MILRVWPALQKILEGSYTCSLPHIVLPEGSLRPYDSDLACVAPTRFIRLSPPKGDCERSLLR